MLSRFQLGIGLALLPVTFSGVWANPQTLIIAGYPTGSKHETVSKLAYEVSRAKGRQVQIAEGQGDWKFAKAGEIHPARDEGDIESRIKEMAAKLKPGESFVVFINDHGHDGYEGDDRPAVSGNLDPLRTGIVLDSTREGEVLASVGKKDDWGEGGKQLLMSHSELMRLLKKYVPTSNKIKLVGIHCFSGGMLHMAFELPNACGSASTDYQNPTETDSRSDMNDYGRGFWTEVREKKHDVNKDGKTSLFEAHRVAYEGDPWNEGRGRLSSMAYVDFVLRRGVYAKGNNHPLPSGDVKTSALLPPAVNEPSIGVEHEGKTPAAKPSPEEEIRELFQFIKGFEEDLSKMLYDQKCDPSFEPLFPSMESELRQCHQNVQSALDAAKRIDKIGLKLPGEFVKDFTTRLAEWQKLRNGYRDNYENCRREYETLKADWEKMSEKRKRVEAAAYTIRFDRLEKKIRAVLGTTYQKYGRLGEEMQGLVEFSRVATKEQKATLERLMACEMEAL